MPARPSMGFNRELADIYLLGGEVGGLYSNYPKHICHISEGNRAMHIPQGRTL